MISEMFNRQDFKKAPRNRACVRSFNKIKILKMYCKKSTSQVIKNAYLL